MTPVPPEGAMEAGPSRRSTGFAKAMIRDIRLRKTSASSGKFGQSNRLGKN